MLGCRMYPLLGRSSNGVKDEAGFSKVLKNTTKPKFMSMDILHSPKSPIPSSFGPDVGGELWQYDDSEAGCDARSEQGERPISLPQRWTVLQLS